MAIGAVQKVVTDIATTFTVEKELSHFTLRNTISPVYFKRFTFEYFSTFSLT